MTIFEETKKSQVKRKNQALKPLKPGKKKEKEALMGPANRREIMLFSRTKTMATFFTSIGAKRAKE